MTGNVTDIQPQDYSGTLVWDSYTDLPGLDCENMRFKVTPLDSKGNGLADSTYFFHLDNNRIPSVPRSAHRREKK